MHRNCFLLPMSVFSFIWFRPLFRALAEHAYKKGEQFNLHIPQDAYVLWQFNRKIVMYWKRILFLYSQNNVGVFPADVSKVSVRSSNEINGTVRQLARSVPPYPVDNHFHTQLQHTQVRNTFSSILSLYSTLFNKY